MLGGCESRRRRESYRFDLSRQNRNTIDGLVVDHMEAYNSGVKEERGALPPEWTGGGLVPSSEAWANVQTVGAKGHRVIRPIRAGRCPL